AELDGTPVPRAWAGLRRHRSQESTRRAARRFELRHGVCRGLSHFDMLGAIRISAAELLVAEQPIHAPHQVLLAGLLECCARLVQVTHALEDESQIAPSAGALGGSTDDRLALLTCALELPGFDVTKGEIHPRCELAWTRLDDFFVDFDGARVEPQPEVDDAEQALSLDILRLHGEG